MSNTFCYCGPFAEIPICGQTIWTIDMFEESPPPLLDMSDWCAANDNIDDVQLVSELAAGDVSDLSRSYVEHSVHQKGDPNVEQIVLKVEVSEGQSEGDAQCVTEWRTQCSTDCWADRSPLSEHVSSRQLMDRYLSDTTFSANSDECVYLGNYYSIDNKQRFPHKLWQIVNECRTDAIKWSPNGDAILVNYPLFQKEYLNRFSANVSFKTENISSFVRQLNLYGFHKISSKRYNSKGVKGLRLWPKSSEANVNCHQFVNEYFRRDRDDLLDKIVRRYTSPARARNQALGATAATAATAVSTISPLKQSLALIDELFYTTKVKNRKSNEMANRKRGKHSSRRVGKSVDTDNKENIEPDCGYTSSESMEKLCECQKSFNEVLERQFCAAIAKTA